MSLKDNLGIKHIHAEELHGVMWKHIETASGPIELAFEFAAGAWVQDKAKPGVAHFHEHMVIKESKEYPDDAETNAELMKLGLRRNARTGASAMTVLLTVPDKEATELGSDVIFEALYRPLFLDRRLEIERGAILAELRQRASSPSTMIFDRMNNIMMTGEVDDHSLIGGEQSVIERISREDILAHDAHVKQHGLVTITTCGPVEPADVHALVARFAKSFPYGNKSMVGVRPQGIYRFRTDNSQQIMRLGYSFNKKLTFRDVILLRLVQRLLSSGGNSFLFEKLRTECGLAYSVTGGNARYGDWSMLYAQTDFKRTITEQDMEDVFQLMERDFFDWLTPERLERLQAYQIRMAVMTFETNYSKMAQTMTLDGLGNEANVLTELELAQRVTFEELQDFAKELLIKKNRFALMMNV